MVNGICRVKCETPSSIEIESETIVSNLDSDMDRIAGIQ